MPAARASVLVDTVGGSVHLTGFGGPDGAPVVLCVHGLGASSAGWTALAETLVPSHRVLALDLPGHGRSPTHGRPVSVPDAAEVLGEVLASLGGQVTLVGHSMGAVVSVLAAAERPSSVRRLVLVAPPLPRDGWGFVSKAVLPHVALCLWPRLGRLALQRRLARQSLEDHVREGLRLTCASFSGLPDVVEALAADLQAAYDGGEDPVATFVHAARSVGLVIADGRAYRDAITRVAAPVDVVHGELDRVVSPSGLAQLESLGLDWRTHVLPGVGHSPHLEAPAFLAGVLGEEHEAGPPQCLPCQLSHSAA